MKSFFKRIDIRTITFLVFLLYPLHTEMASNHEETHSIVAQENSDPVSSFEPIIAYLSEIKAIGKQHNCPQEKIAFLCSLLEQQNLAAITSTLVEAAFEEAAASLEQCKSSSEEIATLTANLDSSYRTLLSAIVSSETTTKGKKVFSNLLVHQALKAGTVTVAGDTIINNNLSVAHNENIGGNLQVAGNTIIEGNAIIQGDTIFTGSVIIPTPDITGSFNLIGSPQQACIIFKDASMHEKARICSSPIPGDKGVFVSIDDGATQNFRVNNDGAVVIEQPASGAALTVVGGGENITGPTTINTSSNAPTSIGYGGTGAVNLGNSVGNIFLPTTLASSQFGDAFVVIDPTTGQVRLDVGGDIPGAIINGGQPGPLTIGTTNATSLALVTSGNNNARFIIDPAGNINVTTGTFSIDAGGAHITGNTNINTSGTGTTTLGNCQNTTNNIFGTTNINSAGTCTTNIGTADGATNIGNSASANTLQGTTRNIGNTYMSSASGVVLTVTGNATNPSTVLVGNSSTIAPALKLINNPLGTISDFILTIDAAGVVKQTIDPIQTGFVINGGQPGPLTIGTTDATTLNFVTNGAQNSRLAIDATGNVTIPNLTTLGGLDVLGTATVNGLLYQLANTISPNNILYVQKGPIAAPNQFNSITDALSAITGNSASNRFEIRVAPGIYSEPTLTMKSYISLIGESQEACIIQASATNQNIIVGAANSAIKQLTLSGATGSGFAAILHTVSGEMHVWNCIFDSNDILINQTAAATGSFIILVDAQILPTSIFTTAFKISPAVSGMPAGTIVNGLLWAPLTAKNITDFVTITGPGAFFNAANCSIGSPFVRVGAAFLNISDGASVRSATASFAGFDTGISVPAGVAPGPSVTVWAAASNNNTLDINIQNPFTKGAIGGSFDVAGGKVIINPLVTNLEFLATSPIAGGITFLGPIFTSTLIANLTNISPLINNEPAIGVLTGGTITGMSTSFTVTVAAGSGYLMTGLAPEDHLQYTTWQQQSLVITGSNTDNFIYVDSNGIVQSALSEPSIINTIDLGKVRTSTGGILFVQDTPHNARHLPTFSNEMIEEAFGPIYTTGSIVTQSGDLQLNVSSGIYFFGSKEFTPTGADAITWETFLGAGTNQCIGNQNSIDYQNYDNGGTLTPIPLGQFARHELYVINGPNETYALVYSQTVFDSLNAAAVGVNPTPPVTWTENICPIASIIVTNTTVPSVALQQILDERPRVGFSAASVAGVSVHGNLLGLLADDHPQYLLVNGTRAMSGTLNMGTNPIANAGTIAASGTLTSGGANITGATNINISGAAATMIGNSSSTTTITGVTNINTTGSATTNIGNNIGPSTTAMAGATTLAATSGIPFSVTGNVSNPTIVSTGNSTTTAPALKLIGNPTGLVSDFFLTIDTNGIVKQTSASIQSGVIINGGQPGPLTIGTTNATTMSFITNNAQRIGIDGTTGVVTVANGETISAGGLTVSAGGASIAGGVTATSGNITANTGNINATAGSMSAGTTITAGTGITATTGNIAASSGNVTASGTVTGGTGVTATTGNVSAASGNVTASAAVSAGTTVTAGTGLTVTTGGASITGTTNINTSGTAATNIGAAGGATNIGSSSSSNTLQGTTRNIGASLFSATSGVVLTVTGNSAQPSTVLVGSSSTTAPAVRLIGNPTSATTDNILTIDALGNVKQGSAAFGNVIYNGGQTGPLTMGTTDATTMSFITNNAQRIGIDGTTGIVTVANGETISAGGLTVSAGGASIAGGVTATSGNITANTGNINATAGSMSAGTTITAGTGITATTGNIAASSGNVTASGTVTGGTGVTATTGNVSAASGNVTASAAISAGTTVTAGAGTVTLPAYSFNGNTNAGLYAPATNQLALVTSNTARLIIDSTGSVSYFSTYKVHAFANATQGVTSGATATVVFGSKTFDPNNNFSANTYTAPISGYYLVTAMVSFTNASGGGTQGGTRLLRLAVNGVTQTGYDSQVGLFSVGGLTPVANSQAVQLCLNDIIQLNQGSTLVVQYTNNAGNTDTIQATGTKLNIHFLSTV